MQDVYRAYLISEAFCSLYAFTILLRLCRSKQKGQDVRWLKMIIQTYIVEVVTDMISIMLICRALPWERFLDGIVNAISVASVALGCFLWFGFVEYRLAPDRHPSVKARILMMAPAAVLCAMDLASAFTGWIISIDQNGHYQYGPLFWLQSMVTYIYLLLPTVHAVVKIFHTKLREKQGEYLTYVLFIALSFFIVEIEDGLPYVPLFELTIFAVIEILFMTLYVDREYALAQKERDLGESRMAIMLSQIQPHFLYNTLSAIAALCRLDPAKAEIVTLKFSDFMRGNLDSLSASHTIPFEQELRHTKTYLDIEQVRFGDRLTVKWNIGVTLFQLPTLTLQPIVENAVRCGVTQRESGGTVWISTAETDAAYTITVEDDGVGFDPMSPYTDGRIHIGIQNVRERLARMCGGTLVIASKPGDGTKAEISIPKENINNV